MKYRHVRPFSLFGTLATVPFLFAANGGGCQSGNNTATDAGDETSCVDTALCDAGWDPVLCRCAPTAVDSGGGTCVSPLGGHCGGNTTRPCSCAQGLVCTPGDSGLPFGDVGGTCETARDAACIDNIACMQGFVFDSVLCRCVPASTDGGRESAAPLGDASPAPDVATTPVVTADGSATSDGGACVSSQGGSCGGNTVNPCSCAPGLVCTPGDSGLPFGDVGGTCEPARDAACIDNVLCIQGDHWDPVLCRCVPNTAAAGGCQSAQDCQGALPQICMVCADGGSACAHFACTGGQCQTVICE
jgi:hypothetical protein